MTRICDKPHSKLRKACAIRMLRVPGPTSLTLAPEKGEVTKSKKILEVHEQSRIDQSKCATIIRFQAPDIQVVSFTLQNTNRQGPTHL